MKNEMKVVARKNLPSKLPIGMTATAYLLMDRFHVAGWIWGAAGVILLFFWAAAIYHVWNETPVEIFDGKKMLL